MKSLDDCVPYYLCEDCHYYYQTGDLLPNADEKAIEAGYESLSKDLVYHEDLGFTVPLTSCDCCGSNLAGEYFKYFDASPIISQE